MMRGVNSQRLLPAPAAETNLLDVDEAHSLDKATFTQSIAEYDAQDLRVEIIRQMPLFSALIQRGIGWDGERLLELRNKIFWLNSSKLGIIALLLVAPLEEVA